MSKKELLDIVLLNPYGLCNPKSFKKKYPSVYKDILTWDFPKEFTFSQKLYHYLYDDRELNLGHCKMCDNRCKYRGFIEGYLECCSHKCAGNNEEKKIRTKQTCLKKYSTEHPMKNKSIKEKWRNTCISECGETHYMKSEKSKNKQTETNIKRYGVENVMYISDVVEKGRQTLFNKTGYYNISQTPEWGKLKKSRVEYDNIQFDSNWEVIVYKYCKENNISFTYHPKVTFKYRFENKNHIYHPDFIINGKYYEIKGDQFFENRDPSKKMICPYDRNEEHDKKEEAKHQCMIVNNVIILTEKDIKNIENLIKYQ